MPEICQTFSGHAIDPKQHLFQQIVIAGGGLAGIFSAYEILLRARDSGKDVNVLLIADKINAPCTAGSHAVLELEGHFDTDKPQNDTDFDLLRDGLQGIHDTVAREGINCRLNTGYEIKGESEEHLAELAKDLIDRNIYAAHELHPNTDTQSFRLPGNPASLYVDRIGQINVPELLQGLLGAIKDMGGKVMLDTRYLGQTAQPDVGITIVHTDKGHFATPNKPLIATGPGHLRTLPGFDFNTEEVFTTGIVIGPLSEEDARNISSRPMAMCDSEVSGDVLWGGIDENNMLTLGRGDSEDSSIEKRQEIYTKLVTLANDMYSGLADKYPVSESYGSMLVPENRMPIVGRMKDYDVAGGWAGMGIVAGYAAAQAYADWVVNGNDEKLKLFESMQPGKFITPTQTTTVAATAPHSSKMQIA